MAFSQSEHDAAVAFNARLGLILFVIYLLLYVSFIYMSAFQRDRMAAEVFAGINLAIVFGFGLIIAAFVLAMVYMALCRHGGDADHSREGI